MNSNPHKAARRGKKTGILRLSKPAGFATSLNINASGRRQGPATHGKLKLNVVSILHGKVSCALQVLRRLPKTRSSGRELVVLGPLQQQVLISIPKQIRQRTVLSTFKPEVPQKVAFPSLQETVRSLQLFSTGLCRTYIQVILQARRSKHNAYYSPVCSLHRA